MAAFLLATLGVSAAGQAAAELGPDDRIDAIERAVVTRDADELRRHLQELTSEGSNGAGIHSYTLGYVCLRLGGLLAGKDRQNVLKQGEAVVKGLIENQSDNAEAHALLGSIYGNRITSAFKGMRLGPKAGKALERAVELSPDNPRVVLQQGISAFYTPKTFGGGMKKAEERLRRAGELFELEPVSAPWPNWGRVDVYAYLGQVLAKNRDVEGARAAYRRGLSIEPEHAWILELLELLG